MLLAQRGRRTQITIVRNEDSGFPNSARLAVQPNSLLSREESTLMVSIGALECLRSGTTTVVENVSKLFDRSTLEGVVEIEVDEEIALGTARALIRRGFPVGPSSGLNYEAARLAWYELGNPEARVVTVFADRMERYFTTELFRPFGGT